jgi:hypothetical protein
MVFNGGSPLHGLGFSLFFKRWMRLTHAKAAVLPTFVLVGLRGIPAHAWERSTTQQLLGPSCWVQGLHEDTAARRDLSAFRVSAWCMCPGCIPSVTSLFIADPAMAGDAGELPSEKKGLVYPIEVSLIEGPIAGGDPPLWEPFGRERRHRRRWRRRSPSIRPPALGPASAASKSSQRPSIHSRMGPSVSQRVSTPAPKVPPVATAGTPKVVAGIDNSLPLPVPQATLHSMTDVAAEIRCSSPNEEDSILLESQAQPAPMSSGGDCSPTSREQGSLAQLILGRSSEPAALISSGPPAFSINTAGSSPQPPPLPVFEEQKVSSPPRALPSSTQPCSAETSTPSGRGPIPEGGLKPLRVYSRRQPTLPPQRS